MTNFIVNEAVSLLHIHLNTVSILCMINPSEPQQQVTDCGYVTNTEKLKKKKLTKYCYLFLLKQKDIKGLQRMLSCGCPANN